MNQFQIGIPPMRRLSLGLALLPLALWPAVGRTEVKVPLSCRIRNLPPERCGWCALETLGRFHGLTALHDLAQTRTTRARSADLEAALDSAKIDYRVQDAGCRNTLILRYAVRQDLGAIVGFRERTPGDGGHFVTLVDFGPETVRVIDSDDKDGRVRTLSRKRFLSWWDGFALVLEPEQEEE